MSIEHSAWSIEYERSRNILYALCSMPFAGITKKGGLK